MDLQVGLPKLGQTLFGTQLTNPTSPDSLSGSAGTHAATQGAPMTFKFMERIPDSNGLRKKPNGREIKAMFIKNDSGGVLLPGTIVDWKLGYRGKMVDTDTPAGGASSLNAGVVDPYLPESGVINGDMFWLIRGGPTYVRAVVDSYTPINNLIISDVTDGYAKDSGIAFAYGDVGIVLESKTTTAGDPYVLCELKLDVY